MSPIHKWTDLTEQHPSARQLDKLVHTLNRCADAQKPTIRQQKASKLASETRAQLLGLVLQFGEVPPSAPSSKRLLGLKYQLTATKASLTTEHPEAIQELRDAMREHDQESLFAQLFTPRTGYDRAKDAQNNMRNASVSKKLRTLFDGIFARTWTTSERAPVLRIDERK